MSRPVRLSLYAVPKFKIGLQGKTPIDDTLHRAPARRVTDLPLDAVVCEIVSRSNRVDVAGKGAGLNTSRGPDSIPAETNLGVKYDGLGERAGIKGLIPVGLSARVAAVFSQGLLVSPDVETMEREELALEFTVSKDFDRDEVVGRGHTTKCAISDW